MGNRIPAVSGQRVAENNSCFRAALSLSLDRHLPSLRFCFPGFGCFLSRRFHDFAGERLDTNCEMLSRDLSRDRGRFLFLPIVVAWLASWKGTFRSFPRIVILFRSDLRQSLRRRVSSRRNSLRSNIGVFFILFFFSSSLLDRSLNDITCHVC